MTEPRKAALCLLITVVLFAAFTAGGYTGFFDLIETRFYNPSVTAAFSKDVTRETTAVEVFITTIERWFAETIDDPAIKRSFLVNQTDDDILQRTQILARLHERLDGLQWVRFIDSAGNRIHYSTWQGDLLREESETLAYRMYTDAAFYQPLEQILPGPNEGHRIIFLPDEERIVISRLFYDALDAYRGLAVFSVSISAVRNRLIAEQGAGRGTIWMTAAPLGLIRGVPEDNLHYLLGNIADYWTRNAAEKSVSVTGIEAGPGRAHYVLISAKTTQGIHVGTLAGENAFAFSTALKTLFLTLFFITVFLILFLFINIKQDPFVVVQNRLKNLQVNLIREYYDQKSDVELSRWGMDLLQRREEIREELKAGLKIRNGQRQDVEIDTFINKSWNDLLAVIGGRLERTVQDEEIQITLNRLTNTLSNLVTNGIPLTASSVPPETATAANTAVSVPASTQVPTANGADVEDAEAIEPDEAAETAKTASSGAPAAKDEAPPEDAAANAAADAGTDEAESVEELDSLEEIESAEPVAAAAESGGGKAEAPSRPSDRFDEAARIVEWSDPIEEEEEPFALELEISSPYGQKTGTSEEGNAVIDDEYEDGSGGGPQKVFPEKNVFDDSPAPLETVSGNIETAPVLYQPFEQDAQKIFIPKETRGLARRALEIATAKNQKSAKTTSSEPAVTIKKEPAPQKAAKPSVNNGTKEPSTDQDIILEEDGVAYIKAAALHPTANEVETLDPRMKSLVDSVLKT